MAFVSVKLTDCPVDPVVPDGNAVSVAVMVACTKAVLKSEPSAGVTLKVLVACPLASVRVCTLVTLPNADCVLVNVQLTVAPGSGFPVASFTSTTAGLKTVMGLVGQAWHVS